MPPSAQTELIYALAPLGLAKTLIATKLRDKLAVYRLGGASGRMRLERLGELQDRRCMLIGRVSTPDPVLRLPWANTLTFYGKWFDELAPADPSYALRSKIAQAPRAMQITQITRDERYGLVGTCYSVFQAIMEHKRRVPLILLDTPFVDGLSLPVVLPHSADEKLYKDLEAVLRLMVRQESVGKEL